MIETESEEAAWAWRSQAYAWFVVVVLAVGVMLSFADRMIIALLVTPIKHDLHLSDSQVGLIHGLAFTILYVLAGLPLGRWADIGSRRGVIAASVVVWSLATGACAAANSFTSFFVTRLVVGVGEAGLSPAAISMISDYFPRKLRSRPLTFLVLGSSAGTGISFMVGGALVQRISAASTLRVPVLGAIHGWQAVFLLLGAIGLVFSLIFLLIREPPRHERTSIENPSVAAAVAVLWKMRGFFSLQFTGIGLAVLVSLGSNTWMPAMLSRRFGWGAGTTGLLLGACTAVAGITGTLMAGSITRWLDAKGVTNAAQKVTLGAVLAGILPMTIGPLLPNPALVLSCAAVGACFMLAPSTLAAVTLQEVVPNEFRGQIYAFYLLVVSFFGYAIGPLAVAFVSDNVLRDEQKVHLSLAIVAGIVLPVAALMLLLGLRAKEAIDRRPAPITA